MRLLRAFSLAIMALPALALPASDETEEPPSLRVVGGFSAGPLVGLDHPLRGAAAGAEIGLAYGWLGALCRGTGIWDARLGAPALRLDIAARFGPDLSFIVGGEIPFGEQAAALGDACVPIAPENFPCRFGLRATIAKFLPHSSAPDAAGGSLRHASRFGLTLDAELAWTAYRASGRDGPLPAGALGEAGFAAGFTSVIALRCGWD